MSRDVRLRVAKLLLALFLGAQAAVALAACEWTERSAARAVSTAAASEPCHTDEQELNANLCLAHCVAGNQSLDKPVVNVFAFSATPVLIVASRDFSPASSRHAIPLPVAGPPPRILFQILLI